MFTPVTKILASLPHLGLSLREWFDAHFIRYEDSQGIFSSSGYGDWPYPEDMGDSWGGDV